MKKPYCSPQIEIADFQIQDSLMTNTSSVGNILAGLGKSSADTYKEEQEDNLNATLEVFQ